MPQTFSPHTSEMPEIAAPTAKCSQFLRAISVEPSAPVKIGTRILTLFVTPNSVSVSTIGKSVLSGVALDAVGQALGAQGVAQMFRWE